ncbi:MAG: FAD-binding oxidoreductase [Candidatus Zixiibacteriota bacterium]|nr:MAG: FAD-binding oxidoreductase [candidate division Zixibacteria bacterium]
MHFEKFIAAIHEEFPDDRLTYQKGVATFHPESAEESAGLFVLAGKHRQKLFVTGFGNNIVPVGAQFDGVVAVKSDRLNQLTRVVPEDFCVEVGAGYPLKELNQHLKEHGLFLPHADMPYVGSIGGALAIGLSALKDQHPLPIGRFFVMAQIAVPEGEVIKPGSACFKSVSGFDVVKIFSPSWGILGMIVTATLRVLPLTAAEEYKDMSLMPVEYAKFADLYRHPGENQSALYSLKIKNKFDPANILPLLK